MASEGKTATHGRSQPLPAAQKLGAAIANWLRCRGGPYLDRYLERHCSGWWADTAMRYQPVLAALRRLGGSASLLEVGSGPFGITTYLRRPVVGVDLAFPACGDLVRPAIASATHLPFATGQFEALAAVDVLEHVPPSERARVVQEMVRVARRLVILAVPCGKAAARQDAELDALYQRLYGERYAFLAEHVTQGLPAVADLVGWARAAMARDGRPYRLAVEKNANLSIRRAFMRSWIETRGQRWGPVEKIVLALMPVLWRLTWGDCYRRVMTLELKRGHA